MAGIYIHVPFCVSRCGYCDFYKTTNFDDKGRYVGMLMHEMALRRDYLGNERVETVYFGGGTPSTLSVDQFEEIFKALRRFFLVDPKAEITVECNPDDMSLELLEGLAALGVNRLSIGIQSFDDGVLRFMQRRHNGQQAQQAVLLARKAGFRNISIDLIYGLPDLTLDDWKRNLDIALSLDVEHISAYHLTFEKDTNFDKLLKKGLIKEAEEDSSVEQFDMLLESLNDAGYQQYEVSNFCRNESYSQHNSNYWKGINYIGFGPSAHSFNGSSRSWNVSHLAKYLASIEKDILPLEHEELSEVDKYNEMLMIGLRTKWGVDLQALRRLCSPTLLLHFEAVLNKHVSLDNLQLLDGRVFLPVHKRMVSDAIISDLFFSLE